MRKDNAKNEPTKREYFTWLREADRQSDHSINQAAAAIAEFERSTRHKDFARFHREQAMAFKRQLLEHRNADSGKPLTAATMHSRLMALKKFFKFLIGREGFRRIPASDLDYFNLSNCETQMATAPHANRRPVPTLAMTQRVIEAMP